MSVLSIDLYEFSAWSHEKTLFGPSFSIYNDTARVMDVLAFRCQSKYTVGPTGQLSGSVDHDKYVGHALTFMGLVYISLYG